MGQPNLNQMMKQVQKMQADMAKAQEELANETVEASAGGGMVTVRMSGDLQLRELRIDPEAVDPEDVEMLQDMVQAAVNEAIRAAQELAASKMNAAAGGLAGRGGRGGGGRRGYYAWGLVPDLARSGRQTTGLLVRFGLSRARAG